MRAERRGARRRIYQDRNTELDLHTRFNDDQDTGNRDCTQTLTKDWRTWRIQETHWRQTGDECQVRVISTLVRECDVIGWVQSLILSRYFKILSRYFDISRYFEILMLRSRQVFKPVSHDFKSRLTTL
ncbi:hypothetical protein DPX16_23505 [Anabarilius grahami]|uniref:Uncharacterized protein n=1 Tax=Anabarilius grahami TaxID=495550 RepID=A0A3N0Z1B1_ANAGA|nr:hypothetical protein DPX16_23505 [Anabarilius grahami]